MVWAGETELVDSYTWYFLVTISTVGYGDIYPVTNEGKWVASLLILFGIGTLSVIIAKVIEFFINLVDKFSRGLGKVKFSRHTVIMGYREGSTEKVIKEIRLSNKDEQIVLCAELPEHNPCSNHRISYIRGELASDDVQNRSNLHAAAKIIIHGRDDNETFFTAYSTRQTNQTAHLVCYLQNAEHEQKIKSLPRSKYALNQVILPVNSFLMAQELEDPESSNVFQQLISNLDGANLYRLDIPQSTNLSTSFETIFLGFKSHYDATIIAIKNDKLISNPKMNEVISDGFSLFYISDKRIETVNWPNLIR
jgi:voltage-gated potassium channel